MEPNDYSVELMEHRLTQSFERQIEKLTEDDDDLASGRVLSVDCSDPKLWKAHIEFIPHVYEVELTIDLTNVTVTLDEDRDGSGDVGRASLSMRARAVWCCLWFGLLPGELYEDRPCHYRPGSYARHVFLNLKTALLWIFWRESEDYRVFEREANPSWKSVWKMMFRPTR